MTIIKVNTIESYYEHIDIFMKDKQYVYCSLGSKQNEIISRFRYPKEDLQLNSNACYQIMPQFVRDNRMKKLIIMIDNFTNEENYLENEILIEKLHENYKMDFILFNYKLSCTNIDSFLDPILNCLEKYNIQNQHFMLANYICYRNTNSTNSDMEDKFRNLLQSYLNNHLKGYYIECYHQWYGYIYLTYNYIYNYKNYNVFMAMHIHHLLSACYKILDNNYLTRNQLSDISSSVLNNHLLSHKWEKFLMNSKNIVEY